MSEPSEGEIKNIQQEIADLARRALIQAGDLQAIEEKLREIVKKGADAKSPDDRAD